MSTAIPWDMAVEMCKERLLFQCGCGSVGPKESARIVQVSVVAALCAVLASVLGKVDKQYVGPVCWLRCGWEVELFGEADLTELW